MTLISTPVVVDLTVSAPTIVVDILTVSGPRGLPGEGGTALVISDSDSPPPDPTDGTMWLQSDTWVQYTWYVDADGGQWVQTNGGGGGGGGIEEAPVDGLQYARSDGDWEVVVGGGGGGDDLDTTPVAAIGSSIEQTVPEWFAGAPVIEITGELFVTADHRGAWVHCLNAIGTVIYLPEDWLPGWSFGARQIGTGAVGWVVIGGASLQIPFTKATHTSILEQYEDVVFRVISNVDGESAVWSFSGATA